MIIRFYSEILKAGLKGSAFFILFIGLQAHADWAGLFDGEARTQKATYNNCDFTFDMFVDAKQESFVAPQLSFWCAMPDGISIVRNHSTVKLKIHPNGELRTDLGTYVGMYTENELLINTFDETQAIYHFFKRADGSREVQITDLTTGEIISGRL